MLLISFVNILGTTKSIIYTSAISNHGMINDLNP